MRIPEFDSPQGERRRLVQAAALGLLVVPAGLLVVLIVSAITIPLWGMPALDLAFLLAFNFGPAGLLLALAYTGLLFLIPVILPAVLSWRRLGSFRLGMVTLLSAVCLQLGLAGIANLNRMSTYMHMQRQIDQRMEEQRTRIQVVSVEAETSDSLVTRFKYCGAAYRHLRLDLIFDCKREGAYRMRVHYSPVHQSGYDVYQDENIRLLKGRNSVSVDLESSRFPLGGFWFRDDSSRVELRVYQQEPSPKPLLAPQATPRTTTFLDQSYRVPNLTAYYPGEYPAPTAGTR